jgi:prolyl-tRNA synthetase
VGLAGRADPVASRSTCSKRRRHAAVSDCATLDEARNAAQTGVARVPWEVVGTSGEQGLATGALTVRCLQLGDGSLPETDADAGALAYIARAY